jgi:ATP-binding cassette subfamily C protein
MIGELRTSWRMLRRRERWQWAATVPLAALAAAMEAVGAAAVYGLVKLIGDPTQIDQIPILSHLAAWLQWKDLRSVVLAATGVVALLYLVKNVTLALVAWVASRAAADSWTSLSQRLLRAYLQAPFAFHLQRNSADLVHNTSEAADVVFRMVMGPAVALTSEALVVLGIVVVLLITAPGVTLIAVALLFTLLAVLVRSMRDVLTRWGEQEHTMRRRVLQTLQQTLEGFKEVRLRGREQFLQERYEQQHRAMNVMRHRYMTLSAVSRLFVETVFITGLLAVVVLVTLASGGSADVIPLLGVYAYAGFRVIPSVNRMLLYISNMRYGLPSVTRVYADLLACEASAKPLTSDAEAALLSFHDRLEVDDLSYTYSGAPSAVLNGISLTVRCGESIGIVGPTGAGKSTLVNLVLGLLTPTAGNLRVDGVDIADVLSSWQRKIGYVPQSVFLTDDTLRRNIAFALADEEIDEKRLQVAVQQAQLGPFVGSLPTGLNTVVGERGVRLSGGERQRVAIARALYHEPELLVFDEATSALDARTERELTRAIEALHGQKTILIVAHRLSTVRKCDRLVFLQKGKVAAIGSFDELQTGCADFRAMAAGSIVETSATPIP